MNEELFSVSTCLLQLWKHGICRVHAEREKEYGAICETLLLLNIEYEVARIGNSCIEITIKK